MERCNVICLDGHHCQQYKMEGSHYCVKHKDVLKNYAANFGAVKNQDLLKQAFTWIVEDETPIPLDNEIVTEISLDIITDHIIHMCNKITKDN